MGKESLEKEQAKSKESMEQPIKTLLVIEDNEENLKVAQEFFKETEIKTNVDYAQDYKTAKKLLEEKKYDGIISDLFFPNDIENLDDTELGKETVVKILERLEKAQKLKEECDGNLMEFAFRDMERELLQVRSLLTGESQEEKGRSDARGDEFKEMTYSKKDQPLGVLILEHAKKNKIPYTMVTAGHTAHGDLSSPVASYLVLEGLVRHSNLRGNPQAFSRGFRESLGRAPTKKEFAEKYGEEKYEEILDYHLNPLMSDVSKKDPETWHTAFYKLSGIAIEQKKEE